MQISSVLAATLLGLVHQAIAEISCYESGWEIDISDSAHEAAVSEFCSELDSNDGTASYEFPTSDGDGDFSVEFVTTVEDLDEDACREEMLGIIDYCVNETSAGDYGRFMGGSMLHPEDGTMSNIACDADSCPGSQD